MDRKDSTDEVRRESVDLYESTPGATLRDIACDLGIARGTLAEWVKTLGTGSTTTPIRSPRMPTGRSETQAEKLVRWAELPRPYWVFAQGGAGAGASGKGGAGRITLVNAGKGQAVDVWVTGVNCDAQFVVEVNRNTAWAIEW